MKLKTTAIKGNEYVEVNTRIEYFRDNPKYKGWGLCTEVVELTKDRAVLKATIQDATGRTVATGIAYENEGSSYINKTSYIENCETSAWGRALGNLGIGISGNIASYEEVGNAIVQQDDALRISSKQVAELMDKLTRLNPDMIQFNAWLVKSFNHSDLSSLTPPQYNEVLDALKKKEGSR